MPSRHRLHKRNINQGEVCCHHILKVSVKESFQLLIERILYWDLGLRMRVFTSRAKEATIFQHVPTLRRHNYKVHAIHQKRKSAIHLFRLMLHDCRCQKLWADKEVCRLWWHIRVVLTTSEQHITSTEIQNVRERIQTVSTWGLSTQTGMNKHLFNGTPTKN